MIKIISSVQNGLKTQLSSYRIARKEDGEERKDRDQDENTLVENDVSVEISPAIDTLWYELELAFKILFQNLDVSPDHLDRIAKKATLETSNHFNAKSPIEAPETKDAEKYGLLLHIKNINIIIQNHTRISCEIPLVTARILEISEQESQSRLTYKNVNTDFVLPNDLIESMNAQAMLEKLEKQKTVFMIKKCSVDANEDISITFDIFHSFHQDQIEQHLINDLYIKSRRKPNTIGEELMHKIIYGNKN